jgi:hypothetical protein
MTPIERFGEPSFREAPTVRHYCLVFFTYKMLLPRESLPLRNTVRPVNPSFLRCRCSSRLNVKGTFFANFSVAGLNNLYCLLGLELS